MIAWDVDTSFVVVLWENGGSLEVCGENIKLTPKRFYWTNLLEALSYSGTLLYVLYYTIFWYFGVKTDKLTLEARDFCPKLWCVYPTWPIWQVLTALSLLFRGNDVVLQYKHNAWNWCPFFCSNIMAVPQKCFSKAVAQNNVFIICDSTILCPLKLTLITINITVHTHIPCFVMKCLFSPRLTLYSNLLLFSINNRIDWHFHFMPVS